MVRKNKSRAGCSSGRSLTAGHGPHSNAFSYGHSGSCTSNQPLTSSISGGPKHRSPSQLLSQFMWAAFSRRCVTSPAFAAARTSALTTLFRYGWATTKFFDTASSSGAVFVPKELVTVTSPAATRSWGNADERGQGRQDGWQ